MKFAKEMIGAFAVSAMLVLPSMAYAASEGFCRDYARAALVQVRTAHGTPFCARGLYSATRWSPDYRVHFDWCLNASAQDAQGERDFRTHYIDECRKH